MFERARGEALLDETSGQGRMRLPVRGGFGLHWLSAFVFARVAIVALVVSLTLTLESILVLS